MTERVERILRRHGQHVAVTRDGKTADAQAFLQPVTGKNQTIPEVMTALGTEDTRLWLYLGRTEVSAGDEVAWGERRFTVRNSAPFYIGEALSHWWAALEKTKEAAE